MGRWRRNASAESNVRVFQPREFNDKAIALRAIGSSSITSITIFVAIGRNAAFKQKSSARSLTWINPNDGESTSVAFLLISPAAASTIQHYPDTEAAALVQAAAVASNLPVKVLLSGFGENLEPQLLRLYRAFVPQAWSALDLIEHAETTIHRVVRMRDPKAHLPQLECRRPAEDQVVVIYASPRRMCGLARGWCTASVPPTASSWQVRNRPACWTAMPAARSMFAA